MEKLIKEQNFVHDDEDTYDNYRRDFHDWISDNEETVTVKQLIGALEKLGQKFTDGSKYPTYKSNGHYQAIVLVDNILSLISDKLGGAAKPNAFQEPCLKLIQTLMRYGMGTIHMAMVLKFVEDSDIEMSDYTKSFTGDKLETLVNAFCTAPVLREDTETREFYDQYSSFFGPFMEKVFEESQLVENGHLKSFFDFAAHIYLDYAHLEEDSLRQVVTVADRIFNYFDKSWKSYKEAEHLTGLLEKITASVKKKEFPKNSEDEMSKRYILSRITRISQEPGMAEPLCEGIFDLLNVTVQSKNKNDELLFTFVKQIVRYFRYQEQKNIKKKASLFKIASPKFKECIKKADIKFLTHTDVVENCVWFLDCAFGDDRQMVPLWIDLAVPLLNRPCKQCLSGCYAVFDKENIIKWKDYQELVVKIFQAIASINIPKDMENEEKVIETFSSCVTTFLSGLKNSRILKKFGEKTLLLAIGILEMKRETLYEMASEIASNFEIDVKACKKTVMDVLQRLHALLKDEDLPWDSHRYLARAAKYMIQNTLSTVKDGNLFTEKEMNLMASICTTCLTHEGLGSTIGTVSGYYDVATDILDKLIEWLALTGRLKLGDKLVPLIIQKYDEDEDDDTLSSYNSRLLYHYAQHGPTALATYLDQILTVYVDKEITDVLYPILVAYPYNPSSLKKHFQPLLDKLLTSGDQMTTTNLAQIFHAASKKQPQLFTEQNVCNILESINDEPSHQALLLQIIQELCKSKPGKVVKHIDLLLMLPSGILSAWINDMLCSLALFDQTVAEKVLNYLLKALNNQDKANIYSALNAIRVLGSKYLDVLKPKRAEVEEFETLDPDGQNMKQMILDLIDGKTTEEMRKQILSQQYALINMENKVEEVDDNIKEVKQEVGKQGEQLDNVTNLVTHHEQRLDQVEETVDETVFKMEEMDKKTLSHAPYWSRDISKLMNPQAEHDWRLLSSRLGYSNNDIRGWAQQGDPCMAMLNEWYATHKTSEATFAILNHLQEMSRMDAAIIVENAMKNAEAVVEDEEFEYASPPPVFISYQWGHQKEVKLLKKHLEMAGYECWMDIGQMGGGDKLFEKIDNGIRAAKVVISCITNKYTKSPNCNREVNLSVGLHKPVIPLLLEQCPWPPPGSMGPIFSESLFIRFFQRKGEETTDQRYWPEPKFLELLMQLNMNGLPPDEGKIESVYKNWWMPIEKEIKIDKSKTRDGGQGTNVNSSTVEEEKESPEVFISYQWGKQKNIIKLYERLTSMGFSCWLDIKQMGGGDSLYDKIDRGIRSSKVVLSCVTQKYALSANCRREVSLADALKKPLLPLLLEKMTWPPAGPMSMVMTQLLYIGFTDENIQNSWAGPQFDELVSKIYQHIPNAMKDSKEEEAHKNNVKSGNSVPEKTNSSHEVNQPKKPTQASKTTVIKPSTQPASNKPDETIKRNRETKLGTAPPKSSKTQVVVSKRPSITPEDSEQEEKKMISNKPQRKASVDKNPSKPQEKEAKPVNKLPKGTQLNEKTNPKTPESDTSIKTESLQVKNTSNSQQEDQDSVSKEPQQKDAETSQAPPQTGSPSTPDNSKVESKNSVKSGMDLNVAENHPATQPKKSKSCSII